MCFAINNPSVVPGSENPKGTETSENNDYHGLMRMAALISQKPQWQHMDQGQKAKTAVFISHRVNWIILECSDVYILN